MSEIALKIYALIQKGIITSNAKFWKNFSCEDKFDETDIDLSLYKKELEELNVNLTCCFDKNFPVIPDNKDSEKPFLFAYRGDISLLSKLSNNIAVIGVLTPSEDIIKREENIVKLLVKNNANIVSGLANGCDTISHKVCIDNNGKTIAFLPTTLQNIYPRQNKQLTDNIVKSGGLIITEYVTEAKNKYDYIKRFIERDRLQAMFSSSVMLIASYRQGAGDSGSRHAMQKAKEYGKNRFVMFNNTTDGENPMFGLNKDLLKDKDVSIISPKSIDNLFKMNILVDLDETLISSTTLNNDAYNFALEQFGFPRIETSERITRNSLTFIDKEILYHIIELKQKYFTQRWMKYRLTLNSDLLELLKQYNKKDCYIWTTADKDRANQIFETYGLDKYFNGILFDKKVNIENTKSIIKDNTKCNKFIIFENNFEYLKDFAKLKNILNFDNFKIFEFELNIN